MKTKMRKILSTFLRVLFSLSILFINCQKKAPEIHWNYSNNEVTRNNESAADSIRIDIYLDATKSMLGFIKNVNSVYNNFLEELETTAGVGWKSADVRFFKFGTKIKEINRDKFKDYKFRQFYIEPGICEKTNIDKVINQTDSSRVSVVITDLFQDEGDVNSIVKQIKERCFKHGIQVAILGIKSEFDGWVYDVGVGRPPYKLKTIQNDINTYRPFYALMFGDPINIERLFNNLKSDPSVKEENFLVLSRHIMKNVNINLTKSRESKSLNIESKRKSDPENLFKFVLKKGNDEGKLDVDISFDRNTRTPDFRTDKIDLIAFKKSSQPAQKEIHSDSVLTNNIVLNTIKRDGNKLRAILDLKITDPPGKYSYMVYLQCGSIAGLSVPQWVRNFSTDNPSLKNDANKTRNLEKFISDLIRANLAIYQPQLAKMYISVRKL